MAELSATLIVKMSEDQRRQLDRLAGEYGFSSTSEFVRVLLAWVNEDRPNVGINPKEIAPVM